MKRVAAIDIGTNSVRLLVAEVDGATPRDAKVVAVDRRMRITRLGQGVDGSGALAPEAMERTTAVLREYRDALAEHGVTEVRATATSAARDASNRDEFFTAAHDALGVSPELLSGEEEAALSFLGATADLDAPAPYLVVDIGGGSTEFVLGTDEPVGLVSLDMGCVRITEQFIYSDPPAPEELSNAVAVVRDLVADVPRVIPGAPDAATLVGLAGTVTTVAAVELGHPRVRPETDPPLPPHPRRGGRRVPYAGDRERRATRAQSRSGARSRRRDRRRRRGARRGVPGARLRRDAGQRGRHPRRSGA